MAEVRVVHYLNQFFAGIGGEDQADHPLELLPGPVGPGRLLQQRLGEAVVVAATIVCGDNRFHDELQATQSAIRQALEHSAPDLVVAGPAFNAGRYGLACGEVCAQAQALDIPAVTGLYPEAPAVEVYRERMLAVPTGESAAGMAEAVGEMARIGLKLLRAERLGPASEEGTLPRGFRANWAVEPLPAVRGVELLLRKLAGEPFQTEIELPAAAELVPPAAPVPDLSGATVALVTEGGLVPHDNPDRIESSSATRWARYPLADLAELGSAGFHSIHAGYDARWVNENPNRILPLDAARALEAAGAIGGLHAYFYVTVGTGTSVTHAARMGQEIAAALIEEGVHAAILTST